ncbi:TAXI family TRAP transporter solute-binding subunit [Nitrobacter sp. JJSN]|uniref:TAXI family TRAP transporter solute-binding subunit n=1 Tax=Nitrobacter sp. JJSN TaxID=3453033 RepID=UPI003F7680D0
MIDATSTSVAAQSVGRTPIKLPLWLRVALILGLAVLATGAGLFGYRYFTHPTTLTVAVGSIDGEAAKAMSRIASRLVAINAPVRLTVIDAGTTLAAAKMFSSGKTDLAVVRGDVGDLSQAQAVIVVSHIVALMIAPPGSSINRIDKLKGRRVGVIGAETNSRLLDVLSREYGLDRASVFKEVTPTNAQRALQSKEIAALLVVIPLSQKYLSLLRGIVQQSSKALPTLIPIDSAAAIAQAERAYESFDVPKGTLRGAPAVPDDDLTTLRTSLYLVANKKLSSDLIASLTQTLVSVRRDLMAEDPIFAQMTAPSTDADAYLALHPGAAAFYNGTQQSFMDEYGNWIYLTPMLLGGMATAFAAAWKFLGIGPFANEGPLDALYALVRRIRKADSEAELELIEDEIDDILNKQRAKAAAGDETAVDAATLNVAAHRLENLIHDRRSILRSRPAVRSTA